MIFPESDSQEVKALFDRSSQIDAQAWHEVADIIEFNEFDKNHLLVSAGEAFAFEGLIMQGTIRSFVTDEKGIDYTLEFYGTGEFLGPHFSRTHESKSFVSLQALESTSMILLNAAKFTQLRIKHDSLLKLGAKVSETELFRKTNKEIRMATKTAKERYMHFRQRYPKLETLIPQTVIASYLGISPVSLSRLRAEK